jgi:nucleotide-binding universal stress UspA family protein
MNVVIPTDFSETSRHAIRCFLNWSAKRPCHIHVLYVAYNSAPAKASSAMGEGFILDTLISDAKEDMKSLEAEFRPLLPEKHTMETYIVREQMLDEAVCRFASDKKADLIVMGTRGAKGLQKIVEGTNAAGVINASAIPVLVIPEKATFLPPAKMLYASTLRDTESEFRRLLPFAEFFGTAITLLHVTGNGEDHAEKSRLLLALQQNHSRELKEFELASGDPATRISEAVTRHQAGMLAMFTHHFGFFDKLMGTSITREMAFDPYVPLLALRENKVEQRND